MSSSSRSRPITERALALPLLGALLLALAGCGSGADIRPTDQAPPMPPRDELLRGAELGPGDVLEVRVYQEDQLTGTYRLSSDGTFDFPLVGKVYAGGETPGELVSTLTDRLKESYIRDPQVSVFVKEYNSKKVYVMGQVNKPGTFPYEDSMTIVGAITQAGGFKDLADQNHTVVTRVVDGKEQKFVIPVKEIGLGHAGNMLLQPGDLIWVPETWL
jgi:polysaccharide export outer membrane protein